MMRAGSLLLASAAIITVFCVFWDGSDNNSNIHESRGSMSSSLYTQQDALYSSLLQKDASVQGADEKVPESTEQSQTDINNNWEAERATVWHADKDTLQSSDKAMFDALRTEMEDESSPQWAKYLRHKHLRSPSPEGHTWKIGKQGKEVNGILMEKSTHTSEKICDKSVDQHHGYFKLSGAKEKDYFYWLFEAKENPKDAPLIMWLTGGPGCSSELALFTENGPCKVNSDGKSTSPNAFSWNRKANILFLDQPAGTGFSYGAEDHSESTISTDIHHFMQELVKKYPQYHKNPFYIFGESYAGHFIPAAGAAVLQGNLDKDGEYVAIRGIGVGNGLTDPEIQYPYYPQMAFNSPTTPKVISEAAYIQMKQSISSCTALIHACNHGKRDDNQDSKCRSAFSECNGNLIDPVTNSGVDVYDLRKPCATPPLCGDYSHVASYLNSERVKNVLGVQKTWRTCNFGVNEQFHVDWMHSQAYHIPPMLENGMRVLIYAGDVDFICNWMGNKAWTLQLPWKHKAEYNKAVDQPWTVNGKQLGKERRFGPFSFLQIHKAGHMVPQDAPAASMLMVDAFVNGKTLVVSNEENA